MKALALLLCMSSISAFAGGFDINDPKILGQYELAQADKAADIQSVKIIYNTRGELILVRDEDQEYKLTATDQNGVIYNGEEEPNCGSGDESNCYYDASIQITLGETKNTKGQIIPQITVAVTVVDAYEEDEDYSYTLVFNWSEKIADAVPYYNEIETPTELKKIIDSCKKVFDDVFDTVYASNRVCTAVDSFQIRDGIDAETAFAAVQNGWDAAPIGQNELDEKVFAPVRAFIEEFAKEEDREAQTTTLLAEAKKIHNYIVENSKLVSYEPAEGSMAWLFIASPNTGFMHRFGIFMD